MESSNKYTSTKKHSCIIKKICTLSIILFFNLSTVFALTNSIVINKAIATNIEQNKVTFYWETSVPTKTVLYLGYGSAFSTMSIIYQDTTYQLKHTVEYTQLKPCKKYFFRFKSTSDKNENKTSPGYTFTTGGSCNITSSIDTIPPNMPTDVYATNITPNGFILKWTSSNNNSDIQGFRIWGGNKGIVTTIKSTKTTYKITNTKVSPNNLYEGLYSGFMIQAFDSAGNFSKPSNRITVFIPDTILHPLLSDTGMFSSRINPTGNPIGGGVYYSNTINKSNAKFIISTKEELKNAITKIKPFEIIYVNDTASIDLTNEFLLLPKGVILASGRGVNNSEGGLLYSNSLRPENEMKAMLETAGDSIRITGLRLKGPSPDIWDHDLRRGVANGIRCKNANLTVDNCEIYNWNKWAVWLYISKNAYIHHNYFHNTTLAGYGYHIWCGGAGSEKYSYALIEANLFEAARHCIASSGHLNSWEARYNCILKKQFYVNLDRHAGSNGKGGSSTIVKSNLFLSTQKNFGFYAPADTLAVDTITDNYFSRDKYSAGGVDTILEENGTSDKQIKYYNNHFNGEGMDLPTAVIYSDTTEGVAPLTIHFDGTGSFDSNKILITRWSWKFGDGDNTENELRKAIGEYTFNDPGVYTLSLQVYNQYGIPSDIVQKTIVVKPSSGKYILSVWVKDSYPDTLTNIYFKQILVDNQVVWSDDVAGDEGWQHIVLDISEFGGPNSQHRIASRMYCKNGLTNYLTQICELFVWTDDFYVFNSTAYEPSFEKSKAYPPWNQTFYIPTGGPGISTAVTSEEYRSGEKSFRLRFAYSGMPKTGQWGEIYQYVKFK